MIALALLTPDPADKAYAARTEVQTLVKSYQALFARFDVEILASPWTVPPPAKAQGALANLAWGYHFQYARWLDRLALLFCKYRPDGINAGWIVSGLVAVRHCGASQVSNAAARCGLSRFSPEIVQHGPHRPRNAPGWPARPARQRRMRQP